MTQVLFFNVFFEKDPHLNAVENQNHQEKRGEWSFVSYRFTSAFTSADTFF